VKGPPFFGVVDPSPLPNSLPANKGSVFTFYTAIGMKGKGGSHYGVLADNSMFSGRKKGLSCEFELNLKSWRCTMAR
jgi:hypothetical protein